MVTTIKVHEKTKHKLDKFREYKNESYDEVINKVVFIAKNVKKQPKLSKETIKAIERSRAMYKKGDFMNEDEVKKKFGI